MAFAQLTYRESLRDLITCLQAVQPMLYHMGVRSTPDAKIRKQLAEVETTLTRGKK